MMGSRRQWMMVALLSAGLAAGVQREARGQVRRPVLDTAPVTALSLDEALRRALPASEAVGIARATVARARGQETVARSEFLPQIIGTASYTRTLSSQFSALESDAPADSTATRSCNRFTGDPSRPIGERVDSLESALNCLTGLNPFAAFGDLPFGQKNQYNFGLQGTQVLFAGGRVRAQSRSAEALRKSAEIGLTAQQAQLTLDVTQAYYNAALADRLLEIARGTLRLADSTYDQTRIAREVGAQPEFDLLRAQVTRDNQRTTVIQRETERTVAFLRLQQLLNLPLDSSITLTTPVEDSVLPSVPALDTLVNRALDTVTDDRAPVRQAEYALKSDEEKARAARAERWPSVTLVSNYARIAYPDDVLPSWDDFVSDWTVGINVRLPIFTGGRVSGTVRAANASAEESRLRLQQTRKRTAVDSRNALEQLRAATAAWAASQGTVAQAERAYTIAEIRYREGISTQTELADARILLEQARANRATAGRDLQIARVRVALLPDLPLAPGS